ncbi:hypothetical protein MLD38_003390 [Melastoma candidum]|uniref:Uncharacterized protein n=1 Tax=Melastoma candidum TaxID=119954 RepID=A0ACB9S3S8_9MYRT|nr:hypothetical protein MLD38_003390 [Melastoma candidum]
MISRPNNLTSVLVLVLLLAALFGRSASNIDQDKAECADKVVGITSCLPYVAGDTNSPSLDCCTGLKTVIDNNKKCICLIIKDRDDPSLGLKINLTLALGLPKTCHTPTNITECVDLLHLDPNSTEAKVFEGSTTAGNTTTSANTPSGGYSAPNGEAPSTTVPIPSMGGAKLRTSWGLKMTCAAVGLIFASLLHTAFGH